jgi:hypothetical protein
MQSHPLPTPVVIVTLLFGAIAFVLYLLALQETLEKCAPASRTMKPWKVWLVLIPLFGLAFRGCSPLGGLIGKRVCKSWNRGPRISSGADRRVGCGCL